MNEEELENWKYVQNKMENEGFHYCFVHYSAFKEIKDKEFHKLRLKYLKTAKALEEYINNKCNEELDED